MKTEPLCEFKKNQIEKTQQKCNGCYLDVFKLFSKKMFHGDI